MGLTIYERLYNTCNSIPMRVQHIMLEEQHRKELTQDGLRMQMQAAFLGIDATAWYGLEVPKPRATTMKGF